MVKKIFFLSTVFLFFTALAMAKTPEVKMFLFYANWNANSHKAQNITKEVAQTYKNRVQYKALDVDSIETYQFIKNNKINIPKYIPSIVLVDKHKKVINTTQYKNESEAKLKNALDSYILPKI